MTKSSWKRLVIYKIRRKIKKSIKDQRNDSEKYEESCVDSIEPGLPKPYLRLPRKLASVIIRPRVGVLDPTQTKPYWRNPDYRCKFCIKKSQSAKQYILECKGTASIFDDNKQRVDTWNTLQTQNGTQD